MPEGEAERRSSWDRLFASSGESESERRVLEYIIHRMNEDGHVRDVVQEEYVRRNLTESQRQDIVSNPRLLEAAHERLQKAFRSGELDPNRHPE